MRFINNKASKNDLSFSHVGIFVKNIELMTKFYKEALQLFVTDRGTVATSNDIVFLSQNPEEHHQLALVNGRPDDATFSVINQISLRVQDLSTLRRYYNCLLSAGAERMDPSTHGNSVSVYSFDPEGNRIEVFMDTQWYCDQPLKASIDFNQSDEEIMNQVNAIAQAAPKFMPRSEWVQQMHTLMNSTNDK